EASGTITLDRQRVGFDVQLAQAGGRKGALTGTVRVRAEERAVDVEQLTVALGSSPWRLAAGGGAPSVRWTDDEVSVTPMELVGGSGNERFGISGTWRDDGAGTLRVTAQHVFLETLQGAFERPTRYGGVLDADMTVRGTTRTPI